MKTKAEGIEPFNSLKNLIASCRKVEKNDVYKRTAGEILFGCIFHKGKKKSSVAARKFDAFITEMESFESLKEE